MKLSALARIAVMRYLRFLATRSAATQPLRRVPGWWSGYTLETPPDGARQMRLKLWNALQGQIVRVSWIDGINLDLRMGTDIARLVFVAGEIDPNEFSFLSDVLKPGMCVVDVGANEGLFTLFFRKRVGPGGRVIALEPSERELIHLKRNLRINRFLDVDVVPLAVGDRDGRARLSLAEADHAGHNALGRPAAPWVSVVDQVEVEVSTLDTLSDARNWPHIDLIKMDIEGSELRALRGADRLLARDRPMLLLEAEQESLSLRGASFSELLSWLAARKYRAMDFSSTDGRPTPLDRREPSSINLVFMPEEKLAPWRQAPNDCGA